MRRPSSRMGLSLIVAAAAVIAVAATAAAGSTASKPIVIGWAFDSKGAMAPFDNPALAAAKLRVNQVNARGGVDGRKLQIVTCDTQGNKPPIAKSCALRLIGQGANIIFTTCDVDLAAPVVQESIDHGLLTVAPCIGTDQMGPKRFGPKGKLAFSFGNVAQDEGSAMAQYAWGRGWRTAALATDTAIVYFKNVVQAFKARWLQLGGKVADEETYLDQAFGGNNVQNAVSRIGSKKADVIVTSTAGAFGSLSAFITGLRSLGDDTPILNSWAGDGTYWLPKSPKVSNYYFVTFASSFGNDPNPAINKLAKQVKAGTGGFITGSAAIDGVVTAIRRSGGSTNGATLAATMEKFKKVPTLSGLVSFSPQLHTVFGRQYRVIKIQNNVPRLVGTVVAKVVPKI
jgi:branched-chain amino acid transport system substrate-binding protein